MSYITQSIASTAQTLSSFVQTWWPGTILESTPDESDSSSSFHSADGGFEPPNRMECSHDEVEFKFDLPDNTCFRDFTVECPGTDYYMNVLLGVVRKSLATGTNTADIITAYINPKEGPIGPHRVESDVADIQIVTQQVHLSTARRAFLSQLPPGITCLDSSGSEPHQSTVSFCRADGSLLRGFELTSRDLESGGENGSTE